MKKINPLSISQFGIIALFSASLFACSFSSHNLKTHEQTNRRIAAEADPGVEPDADGDGGSAAAEAAKVPVLAACPFDANNSNWKNELLIYHFYIGQGSSTLVRTPSGTTVLIDAGLPGEGTSVILPILKACDITSLDYGVLTHPHIDHFGGWIDIFNAKLPVKKFYLATEDDDAPAATTGMWYKFKTTLSAALKVGGSENFSVPALGVGAIQDKGGQVVFEIVAVNGQTGKALVNIFKKPNILRDCNAASIAQIIHYKNFSYWEGGDITSAGFGDKTGNPDVESSVALSVRHVDVFHANHHGSDTSNGDALLAALTPQYAVVSAGIGVANGDNTKVNANGEAIDNSGSFHLPNVGALNRMQAHGVKAIYMTSKGESQRIVPPATKTGTPTRYPVNILTDKSVLANIIDNDQNDLMLTTNGSTFNFYGKNIKGPNQGPFNANSH